MRKFNFYLLAVCSILQITLISANASSAELRIWNSDVSKLLGQSSGGGTAEYTSYTSLVIENDTVRISSCSVLNRDIAVLESLDKNFKFGSCETESIVSLAQFEAAVFARSGQSIHGSAGSITWSTVKTGFFGYISVVSGVGAVGTVIIPPVAVVLGLISVASGHQTVANGIDVGRLAFGITLDETSTNQILTSFANRKSGTALSVVLENYDDYMDSFYHALKFMPKANARRKSKIRGPEYAPSSEIAVEPIQLDVLYLAP